MEVLSQSLATMVTKRNLLLLVATLTVVGVSADPDVPDVDEEAVKGDVLLDGKRDKRHLLLGYGLGLGKGLILGKAAGLVLGKHFAGHHGGEFIPEPSGGYPSYPQYRHEYIPYDQYYYDAPEGGYYGGGYGGAAANSKASAITVTGGFGPFNAGFSKSDATAYAYAR